MTNSESDPPRDLAYEAEIITALEEVQAPLPFPVRAFGTLDSTMVAAREWARAEPGDALRLVVARSQRQGRGRRGRTWSSEGTGLYATFVVGSRVAPERLTGLSLVVGVATMRMLEKVKPGIFGLKWPNDVLSRDGKKLSGTLIELVPEGGGKRSVLIGIGLNCTGNLPAEVPACSLEEYTVSDCRPAYIAALLAKEMHVVLNHFFQMGFTAFRDEWIGRALYLNSSISITDGEVHVTGTFRGLHDTGAILLQTAAGERVVSVGDVEAI